MRVPLATSPAKPIPLPVIDVVSWDAKAKTLRIEQPLSEGVEDKQTWRVQQMLVDPEGDNDREAEFEVAHHPTWAGSHNTTLVVYRHAVAPVNLVGTESN
jgi:hypothetical protein